MRNSCTFIPLLGGLKNQETIDYDQLYAQLYAELEQGRRYWFDDEENTRIMQQNEHFRQVSSYEQIIELGKRLTKMGYEHKRTNKGSVFRVEEI